MLLPDLHDTSFDTACLNVPTGLGPIQSPIPRETAHKHNLTEKLRTSREALNHFAARFTQHTAVNEDSASSLNLATAEFASELTWPECWSSLICRLCPSCLRGDWRLSSSAAFVYHWRSCWRVSSDANAQNSRETERIHEPLHPDFCVPDRAVSLRRKCVGRYPGSSN